MSNLSMVIRNARIVDGPEKPEFVREEKRMTFERAVQRLRSDLARDWKIAERGVIREGMFADLVLFDPDTIARGPELRVEDLPGGGGRFMRHATGIDHVIVNGSVIVSDGAYAESRPGSIL